MKNWLIHFLGCVRIEGYNLLNIQYLQQRELVTTYRAREEQLLRQIEEVITERKDLQQIIFRNFGIITDPNKPEEPQQELQPVRVGPQRWSNLRTALEQDDRQRVEKERENHVS